MSDHDYITRAYVKPRNAGAFGGISTFAKARRIKDEKRLRKILSGVESYSLHFPVRRKFRTRPLLYSSIGDLTSSDLADFTNISKFNKNYKFCLVFNDCLSKQTYFQPIKDKSSKNVSLAFQIIFKRFKYPIRTMLTDHGNEWKGDCAALFKKLGIKIVYVNSLTKASPSENRIKWLRMKLARYMTHSNTKNWIDVIDSIEKSYNESYSKLIKMRPIDVNKRTEDLAWHNNYEKFIKRKAEKNSLSVGDRVRLSRYANLFDKRSFNSFWSKETFRITAIKKSFGILYYKVEDSEKNPVDASFYKSELQKIENGT